MSVRVGLDYDEEVGGPREALEAVDGEVEVADEEGLVALRPHEEGAHVGLEELAAADGRLLVRVQFAFGSLGEFESLLARKILLHYLMFS